MRKRNHLEANGVDKPPSTVIQLKKKNRHSLNRSTRMPEWPIQVLLFSLQHGTALLFVCCFIVVVVVDVVGCCWMLLCRQRIGSVQSGFAAEGGPLGNGRQKDALPDDGPLQLGAGFVHHLSRIVIRHFLGFGLTSGTPKKKPRGFRPLKPPETFYSKRKP